MIFSDSFKVHIQIKLKTSIRAGSHSRRADARFLFFRSMFSYEPSTARHSRATASETFPSSNPE